MGRCEAKCWVLVGFSLFVWVKVKTFTRIKRPKHARYSKTSHGKKAWRAQFQILDDSISHSVHRVQRFVDCCPINTRQPRKEIGERTSERRPESIACPVTYQKRRVRTLLRSVTPATASRTSKIITSILPSPYYP